MNVYECENCIYYPPSSLDGKPCCMCGPNDPLLYCYCERIDISCQTKKDC